MLEPKDRLIKARTGAGYPSPTEAARAIRSINKNTLISHENGNRPLSRKAAEQYAQLFDVTAGWLLFGEETAPETETLSVPLISFVAAGKLREQDAVLPADIDRYIHQDDLPKGDWIALTVDGSSMNRIAPDGSVIVVNRTDDRLIDGKYYVFGIGGQTTFKTFRRSPDRAQPFSTDPDFMSISLNEEDFYVFGRVRRVIQDV